LGKDKYSPESYDIGKETMDLMYIGENIADTQRIIEILLYYEKELGKDKYSPESYDIGKETMDLSGIILKRENM